MPRTKARTAFVGRSRELAALCAALDAAGQGAGGIVLISGEPGIGKTRITTEFSGQAEAAGWLVLAGAAYDAAGMPPYLPFVEVLQGYARSCTTEQLLTQLGPGASDVILPLPEAAQHQLQMAASDSAAALRERYRLFERLTETLLDIARRPATTGLLLCLDDLHWADEPTLLLLEHLVRRMGDVPLLVAATFRDTEVEPGQPLARTLERLARREPVIVERVALQRLPQTDTAALLTSLAGRSVPAALVRSVHAETEGNPFFVHEVYQYLAATGRLVDSEGGWQSEIHLGEVDVPPTVRLVIERRLEAVSPACRQVLTVAATIGRSFDYPLLQATADIEEPALLDALDEAGGAHLLAAPADEVDGRMAFAHELIRQTLLVGLSLPRRQQLHRRVAVAIERVYAGKLDRHFAALALHYRQAGAAADLAHAITYSLQAGEAAWNEYAFEPARDHWQTALALMEEQQADPERRAGVMERLGDVMYVTGFDRSRGIDYLEQAIRLLEQTGGQERAGVLHSKLGTHFCNFPMTDIPRALVHFHAAERAWQGSRIPVPAHWTAHLDIGLATAYCQAVDTRAGLAAAQRAMAIAGEAALDVTWALTAALRAWHLLAAGRLAEGVALFEQAWETGDRFSDLGSTWVSGWTAGVCTHLMGDPLTAQNWVRRELNGSRMASGGAVRRVQLGLLGYWQVESGDLADARGSLVAAATEAWVYFIGQLRFLEGDWEAAEALSAQGRELAIRQGDRFNIVLAGFDLAKILATTGRTSDAVTLLKEGLSVALDGESVLLEMWVRPRLILLSTETDQLDEARSHLTRCREVLAQGEDWRGMAGRVALAEAAFAAATGDVELAETAFQQAVALFRRYTLPWDEAEALHLWGRVLASAGRHTGAREQLDGAEAIYRRHGAGAPWLARIEADRSRLNATPGNPRPAPMYPDGLTAREVEVLRLVAEGGSNREIATKLVLSVRTVERHIENIYLKTGIPSRMRVVHYAQEHNLT